MKKRLQCDPGAPFQRIPDACRITGRSMHVVRIGSKSGTAPHSLRATTHMINVPALLKKLEEESHG